MKKILWISPYAPYDSVAHGGGQNHNYYLKYFKRKTDFDITLLTVCDKREVNKMDLNKYDIDYILKVYDSKKIKSCLQKTLGKVLIHKDGGLLNRAIRSLLLEAIKEYHYRNEKPDVIITQWTEATLLYYEIKKYFSSSIYIAIEEDVAYLGYQRKYEAVSGLYKLYKKSKCKFLKHAELNVLQEYNCVLVVSKKDKKLLLDEGIENDSILVMSPYFKSYSNAKYTPNLDRLLFYGAMSRIENYKSAIWFIEKVMPKLPQSYRLTIVGSNPHLDVLRYNSDRISITGFVDNVQSYLENSLCLVSPLLLGAGIKIKVLEALSAGLPVLTNSIGAEGINLTNDENYIHCESEDDYVSAIIRLRKDNVLRRTLSEKGREHVLTQFNVDASLDILIAKINGYKKNL